MEYRDFIHIVPSDLQGRERLSKYAVGVFPYLETGSAVKKAIKKRQVKINGRIGDTGDWVVAGDKLKYETSFEKPIEIDPIIEVVYEDDYLIIINKPPGLLSSGESGNSLQNILKSYPASKSEGALFYPYLIHRLDRQTSGLIIAARTIVARRRLGEMVEQRKLIKEYSLLVEGYLDTANNFIKNEIDNKESQTEILTYSYLKTKDDATYVRVRLHTGRTHQIRRHFFEIGHPVIGDDIYNPSGLTFGRGLFLMADYISFEHPILENQIEVNVNLHNKFLKYVNS